MSNDILLWNDLSWFKPVRETLFNEWQAKTVAKSAGSSVESLACSITHVVKATAGHLSLACSLHGEAEQIENLLNKACFDDDPVAFFRLLLFLLDEFTARMQECYKLLGKKPVPKQPDIVSIWTNRYAKHRTAILIQHHAQHLFEDEPEFTRVKTILQSRGKIAFIDTTWLKANVCANVAGANQDQQSVVIVPKLNQFLIDTISYYADFCIYACSTPNALEQFQSPHHLDPLDLTKPNS